PRVRRAGDVAPGATQPVATTAPPGEQAAHPPSRRSCPRRLPPCDWPPAGHTIVPCMAIPARDVTVTHEPRPPSCGNYVRWRPLPGSTDVLRGQIARHPAEAGSRMG